MSNGFASALELSARIIRENDATTARRLITETIHEQRSEVARLEREGLPCGYSRRMLLGYEAVLEAMYRL